MIPADKWTALYELKELVESERMSRPIAQLWGNLGSQFREAWCATEFGTHFGASEVMLPSNDEKSADFVLRCPAGEHRFQTKEVLTTGRRRGVEDWKSQVAENITEDELDAIIADVPEALAQSLKKLEKYKQKNLNLLIYFNCFVFGIDEISKLLIEGTSHCLRIFNSVYILKFSTAYERCHNDTLKLIGSRHLEQG